MIFYFLYYFSSFHFIFIYSRFISFFLFSFFCFSPPQKCPAPFPLFFFSPQEHSNNSFASHQRERERERERGLLVRCPTVKGDRGCRKDKAGGDQRSPCSTTTSVALPLLVLLPTTRLGQIRVLFFFFFF